MINRKLFLFMVLLASVLSQLLTGCSDSGQSPTTPGGGAGSIPIMRIHQGSRYTYTNDSLINNNSIIDTQRTRIGTFDNVFDIVTIENQSCFRILSTSYDTNTTLITRDTMFVRYDSTAGKVYQYGVKRLINPLQPPSWDLVADFSVARGTTWSIGDINASINVPGFGNVDFSGPLTGKVADSTNVNTTATPSAAIHCYRIELNTNISGTVIGQTVTASIFIDYYLGYYSDQFPNNPSGIIRITFRPFSFNVLGTPVLYLSLIHI